MGGLLVMAAGYAIYGYVDDLTQLIIVQLILALGISLSNVMIIVDTRFIWLTDPMTWAP